MILLVSSPLPFLCALPAAIPEGGFQHRNHWWVDSPPSSPNWPWRHHPGCSDGPCVVSFDPRLWACCLCYREDLCPASDLWNNSLKYAKEIVPITCQVRRLYSSVYRIKKSPCKARHLANRNHPPSWAKCCSKICRISRCMNSPTSQPVSGVYIWHLLGLAAWQERRMAL